MSKSAGFAEQLGGRSAARFFLVIEITELLSGAVSNDEGGTDVLA